jgi:hypothetical protein
MLSMDHRVKPGGDELVANLSRSRTARRQPEHPLPELQKVAADAL